MRKIFIFDLIGIHSGMHYYDLAFAELLKKHNQKCIILSNFEIKGYAKIFFPNFFNKGKVFGIIGLLYTYLKFLFFLLCHRKDKVVYLTFGELYEIPFLLSLAIAKNAYVDVHEVHALKYKDDSCVSRTFEWIYRHVLKKVIFHSDRTKMILGNEGLQMFYVPHFKYVFKKEYNKAELSEDVRTAFEKKDLKHFLFFGNLSIVKGIDTILEVFGKIKDEYDFELVIAGKNVDAVDFSSLKSDKIRIIDRHINDDELVYLYSHTDYVLLPYKKSSQSGIFAMSAYFRKPMILSDIPYFEEMIAEFPSFGIIIPLDKYRECVEKCFSQSHESFFTQTDCDKFELKKEYEVFINKFIEY